MLSVSSYTSVSPQIFQVPAGQSGLFSWLNSRRLLQPARLAAPEIAPNLFHEVRAHVKPKPSTKDKEEYIRYLVDCILAGDSGKFDELSEIIRDQIYAVAWRYTSNREDALDISQNVLIRIYRALKGWQGRCRFSTWVHRIAMNAAVDYHRRHARHEQQRVDPESANAGEEVRATSDPFLGVTHENARHSVARREFIDAVHAALPQLSNMQRESFILRHFHGLSVADIAETLGCGEGSVKQHLFRASKKLRNLLSEYQQMLEPDTMSAREDLN